MDTDMNSEGASDDDDFDMISHAEYKEQGNAAYKGKDYRTAIAKYTLAIDAFIEQEEEGETTSPDPAILASYYNNRAAACTMILRYEDAVNDSDTAITIHPPFLKGYIRKAKAQVSLGQLEEAIATLNNAAIRDPNNSAIMQQKQEAKKLVQRIELAKQLLTKTKKKVNVYPPFPLPSSRDAQQALNQINVVIAACPALRTILIDKMKALVALNRADDAYALSTSIIRNNDGTDESSIILYRAFALHEMGNLEGAVKHLKQILSGDPDNKAAFGFFKVLKALEKKKAEADGYYKKRDFEKAAEAYSEALVMDGCVALYKAKLYFNRACVNANLRKHAEVVEDCTKALKLDSEYAKAIMRRAASNLLIGGKSECGQAIRDYETAMALAEKKGDELQQKELKKKIREAQVQLKRAGQKDLYKILNVGKDATEAEIKKAYRKSALKWHPDRHASSTDEKKQEAENIFRDVNLAYEVLSDPEKKKKYNSGVDVEDLDNPNAGCGHGHGGHGGIDPSVIFQMFMQQQGGGGGGGVHFR
mmetsp:Transcript_50586/g.56465  ORF Transcript_50586/g.56465 Transcript_50586/m.56465 type:complete len:533 (-) Transcript_50586:61-1659(-)